MVSKKGESKRQDLVIDSIKLGVKENLPQEAIVKTETSETKPKMSSGNQSEVGLATEKSCAHFWKIETPNGPSSKGVCKYCGSTSEFMNAFPTFNPLRRKGNNPDIPEPEVELKDFESSR
jgi:hypothetical protein